MAVLLDKIKNDLKDAMKAGNSRRVGVLRMLISAIGNRAIEKRAKVGVETLLTDEETLEVVVKEAKKRKESIALFIQGGREDLAANEREELSELSAYLPLQMDDVEVRKVVQRIIADATAKDFGSIMKDAMKELRGKADASVVAAIVKEQLA